MTKKEPILVEAERRGLTLGAPSAWTLDHPLDRDALQQQLRHDGYFALPPAIPAPLLARCRDAIELVRAAGAPPLAAFAFDAPWEIIALLDEHARAALDGDARLMPAFWAWRLAEGDDARGWPPHRDQPAREVDDRGVPASVSLWIALTDATPDNGCIHVVPAPWDPQYHNPNATADVLFLQSIRAVPAAAGAVLGWSPKLLHWGAMARPGTPPRVSLSFELQSAAVPPFDGLTYPLAWIPPPAERRALIDRQWQRYRHMHDATAERAAALAHTLDALLPL